MSSLSLLDFQFKACRFSDYVFKVFSEVVKKLILSGLVVKSPISVIFS